MNKTVKVIGSILILIFIIGIINQCSKKEKNSQAATGQKKVSTQKKLNQYQNQNMPIQFSYSPDLQIRYKAVSDTSGWSYESTEKGRIIAQLKLKSSVQPKTNLAEATFTVGRTGNKNLLKTCMQKPAGYMLQADSLQKGSRTYYRTKYSDAGAGNYYTVVQYRTIRGNYCYSIEEMVHTTNIHNYPPERGISRFDSAKVWGILDKAWQTFHFTK